MLRLDHVVYVVADLDDAAERWRRELGLDSADGGRHEHWGTANRIAPLGEQYLELIGVVDEQLARSTPFGALVLDRAAAGGGWLMPVLATDDLEAIAARLGVEIAPGARRRPDGETLRWRSAGFDDPRREPWMPFFIQWDVSEDLHPSRARADHRVHPTGIARAELGGARERIAAWVGAEVAGLVLTGGADGLAGVSISTADGELPI